MLDEIRDNVMVLLHVLSTLPNSILSIMEDAYGINVEIVGVRVGGGGDGGDGGWQHHSRGTDVMAMEY
ncbi:hypothetical protein BLOT_002677 [Blomia tropicalis]|nr:hypothetical protein BLOT_002677 [Blomia tropicalis]